MEDSNLTAVSKFHLPQAADPQSKNARKTQMNKLSDLGLVDRARALAPLIAREADEIERTRRLTPAVTADIATDIAADA